MIYHMVALAVKPASEGKVMLDLSISIVSYNTRDLLKQCLESIHNETRDITFETFVVDNASTDETVEIIRRDFPSVKLIANRENRGFAAANKKAIKESKGRYVVLLNPDTVILDSCLDRLVNFMDSHFEAGVVGPQILNPDGTRQFSYDQGISLKSNFKARLLIIPRFVLGPLKRFKIHFTTSKGTQSVPDIKEVGRVRGCCFLARRDAIDQVGLMDERFFLYCEEVDWAYRMRKAGWKIYFYPFAYIIHNWGQSTIQVADWSFITHHKSDYKYFKKHYGNYAVFLARGMFLIDAVFGSLKLSKDLLLARISQKEAKHRFKLYWKVVWIRYEDNQDAGNAT